MAASAYVFTPCEIPSLPVVGSDARFPIHRVYCVGRNYAAHAIEMGHDPDQEPPFFFQKNPDNVLGDGKPFPYPGATSDVHHEVELVVALSSGGRDIAAADAMAHVYGYALGIDFTRRDIQAVAKKMGRPWEAAKAFEHSAPCGAIVPAAAGPNLDDAAIRLEVNGAVRQEGNLNQLIWKVPEVIAHLSRLFELRAGDLIMTGTPSGVGAVVRGDRLRASVAGMDDLVLEVV
ncbi:fumarylacetoacetate hydrolase family protein [Salinarimonas ramus]|uniref:Fumarylacetoacetase n=1 Tax=Salinarimonas ramus TaxID=690164 RepID=A0A917Q449_9HYPH|nr:fumarylacetoacetate hydrolase family protein [Salinarimonas ramus]GGK20420.1 fumarylacetoacetase [Salinarimonas ramus]